MKTKLSGYYKFWPVNGLKYLAFNVHNLWLLFCLFVKARFMYVKYMLSLFVHHLSRSIFLWAKYPDSDRIF